MKALDMRCVLFIIRWFHYQRLHQERVQHQHWNDGLVTTFNEDDCVLSVCGLLPVSFAAVCASACWRDTQRLIRGDACCISAVVSDYNRSNISICAFNNQMRLHSSSFVWIQTSSWSGLSDQIYIRLESVSGGVYTWSFQDRIAIPSQKTRVTRCK